MIDDAEKVLTFADNHRTAMLAGAGVLLILLAAVGAWIRKHGRDGKFFDQAAVLVAVALSAEGMWEAATEGMGLKPWQALLVFAFAELAMLRAARRARNSADKGESTGWQGPLVWVIAIGAGVVAATNAPNVTEGIIRVGAPLLVAAQWWGDLAELLKERRGDKVQRSSWIWTPRRIGIELGLIQAGETDLAAVDRNRRIHRLTVTSHRLHHGMRWLAGVRRARLRRLALRADDDMVTEAQRRVARVNRIEQLTRPDAPQGAPLDDADRDALAAFRVSTRGLTRDLAAQRREAFPDGVAWSNDVVKMPAHIAARIGAGKSTHRPDGVTQTGDAPADLPVTRPDAPTRPVAHADTAQGDAPEKPAVTRKLTHPAGPERRTREVVMRRPVSAPPADSDPAARDAAIADGVTRVLTQRVSVRQAARDAGIPEATMRRHVAKASDAGGAAVEPKKVNGHAFASAGK